MVFDPGGNLGDLEFASGHREHEALDLVHGCVADVARIQQEEDPSACPRETRVAFSQRVIRGEGMQ